jgi:CDGSH-type Zn-finger protein
VKNCIRCAGSALSWARLNKSAGKLKEARFCIRARLQPGRKIRCFVIPRAFRPEESVVSSHREDFSAARLDLMQKLHYCASPCWASSHLRYNSLSYSAHFGGDAMAQVKITVRKNGPYRVEAPEGSIELVDADGNPYDLTGKPAFSLCRCGASVNKPFCDGTHSKMGFEAAEAAVKKEEEGPLGKVTF